MAPDFQLELTGRQFAPLSKALRATLTPNQFDRMLKERLEIERPNISLGGDYVTIVSDVIGEANRAGWVHLLVDAAREERPTNPVFLEYAQMLGTGPEGLPKGAALEGIVRGSNTSLDIAVFLARAGAIVGQVCRIDIDGDGAGTGFLVGKSAVLTNYHVVEPVLDGRDPLEKLACRFDFKVREDGNSINQGTVIPVTQILLSSPYDDPADLQDGPAQPDPAKLDYALLQLEGAPGADPVGGKPNGEPRGWVAMPAAPHPFAPRSPLFIVQHPDKKPMKLALDTQAILRLNATKTRVRYSTNTLPGSSGSPCFSQDWGLVALHHSGDARWTPTWNEGIPITLVADQIRAQGFGSWLE
jgi:hypothetical protein